MEGSQLLLQKDAKIALSKACKTFILYLAACSNDFSTTENRTLVTGNDVLSALEELDFAEFIPILREAILSLDKLDS